MLLPYDHYSGNVIKFTMWDEMARRFEDAKLDTMQQPIIIEVSSWQVSKYRGIYLLQNLYITKKYSTITIIIFSCQLHL